MSVRIAAIVGSTLGLLTGCPSTFGCDPPSKQFSMDETLTQVDVDTIMANWGHDDPATIRCEQACSYKFQQTDGWQVSKEDSCTHDIDANATEDPVGSIKCSGEAIEYFCEGRRPMGFAYHAGRGAADDEAFLGFALLEAASVIAFERLADRLVEWGAPNALIDRCRLAAEDERRHAEAVRNLARARGARGDLPPMPEDARPPVSMVEEALHNAVEGCVAETWAALVAHVRACRSPDPRVRACYQSIAQDETRHAQLAWDLHEWFVAQLDEREAVEVELARRRALARLPVQAEIQARATHEADRAIEPIGARELASAYGEALQAASA